MLREARIVVARRLRKARRPRLTCPRWQGTRKVHWPGGQESRLAGIKALCYSRYDF
jgi:hypothetical protein